MDSESQVGARRRRLVPKPAWMERFEVLLARRVSLHPNILSTFKLLLVLPVALLAQERLPLGSDGAGLPEHPGLVAAAFALFAALDYLDGVVARKRGLETAFGRVWDRITDLPMIFVLTIQCADVLPIALVATKLTLDLVLMVQFILVGGTTENRIRTTITYGTLVSLLFLSQGWAPAFVSAGFVQALLAVNVAFSALVVLFNAEVLRHRHLANLLSGVNLLCGVASIGCAIAGAPEKSLVFLLLGAAFDGFDGAAARRYGSTSWGVYSDDVADGVNYALAPGVALVAIVRGLQGWVLGVVYVVATVGRLVYFTLNKKSADPNYFSGVPSTVGALVALTALSLFADAPALVGLLVGLACAQMITFDTHYKHLGRALFADRRLLWVVGAAVPLLAAAAVLGGPLPAAALLLLGALVYGFAPTAVHFRRVLTGLGRPA